MFIRDMANKKGNKFINSKIQKKGFIGVLVFKKELNIFTIIRSNSAFSDNRPFGVSSNVSYGKRGVV